MIALLLRVALRNLLLYRVKTLVIGALLGSGACLAVLGLSLVRDIESSMRLSVIESVAGHLQVYSAKAKDDLALFGGAFMGRPDIGTLPDLAAYREVALAHPNVEAFVPMGQDMAILSRGNEMDELLDALRAALRAGEPSFVQARLDQLAFQLQQLEKEVAERRKVSADDTELTAQETALATVKAPGFLDALRTADEAKLQYLETKVAPISGEKAPIYLNYLGVDIELYVKNFSKFKIVSGAPLPAGRRGILLNHKVRETYLKILVARLFDRLHKRVLGAGVAIAGDPENQRNAADLRRQYGEILANLDRTEARDLSAKLAAAGFAVSGGGDLLDQLTSQLQVFLTVDDASLRERYQWFYDNIVPLVRLYEISPGETVTLRSYTRSGYIKSLPLKVYGVYTFEGLEESDLAGAMNITDLVSFRELYGQMTESSRRELDEMRRQAGIKDVSRDDAEAALFGENAASVEARALAAPSAVTDTLEVKPLIEDSFDETELRSGLALNAAVKLKDPTELGRTQAELLRMLEAKGLDARVVDWQAASGIVGQFVNIVRLVLVFALTVIFLVGLVIINNSIIASTFHRIREIGTMRAIGAPKSFVLGLFLAETAITGFAGAALGAALALAGLMVLGRFGIPAGNDVVTFLFSGPRLYPTTPWEMAALTPLAVTLIATLTSLYAARHAAEVRPADAMQEKE
jgi:ABC-type lipoprotein release transport system permease subunit